MVTTRPLSRVRVNERRPVDAIAAGPADRERSISVLDVDRFATDPVREQSSCCLALPSADKESVGGHATALAAMMREAAKAPDLLKARQRAFQAARTGCRLVAGACANE
jgi:hypothetical protein